MRVQNDVMFTNKLQVTPGGSCYNSVEVSVRPNGDPQAPCPAYPWMQSCMGDASADE